MEEKLRKLMKHEGINSTKLAEMLGIQASGISHIMSGRNKPSYDFIVKLLNRFPQINPDWLLIDKGPMYRDEIKGKASATTPAISSSSAASAAPQASVSSVPNASPTGFSEGLFSAGAVESAGSNGPIGATGGTWGSVFASEQSLDRDDRDIIPQKSVAGSSSEMPNTQPASTVERIVVFFRNKTFAEYHPE